MTPSEENAYRILFFEQYAELGNEPLFLNVLALARPQKGLYQPTLSRIFAGKIQPSIRTKELICNRIRSRCAEHEDLAHRLIQKLSMASWKKPNNLFVPEKSIVREMSAAAQEILAQAGLTTEILGAIQNEPHLGNVIADYLKQKKALNDAKINTQTLDQLAEKHSPTSLILALKTLSLG